MDPHALPDAEFLAAFRFRPPVVQAATSGVDVCFVDRRVPCR